jgi:hypothetical protein
MTRTKVLGVVIAAALALSPIRPPAAQAQQQPTRVELDQSLLDRWIAVFPAFFKMSKSNPDPSRPETEAGLRAQMEKACAGAGFDGYDQCAEVFGYVGMIVSACDRRTRTFRDPIVLMRRQIARIEADTKLSAEQKDKATAELRQVVARFPDNIPAEHLRLMTANRDRVFAVLLAANAR